MSKLIDIPIAVAAALNAAGSFSMPFRAEQKTFPILQVPDFKDLKVYVLSCKKNTKILTRSIKESTVFCRVLIGKTVNIETEQVTVNKLIEFLDEIDTFLLARTLQYGGVNYTCVESIVDSIPNEEDLQNKNLFQANLTFGYKVIA
jgi:hypothetical protein